MSGFVGGSRSASTIVPPDGPGWTAQYLIRVLGAARPPARHGAPARRLVGAVAISRARTGPRCRRASSARCARRSAIPALRAAVSGRGWRLGDHRWRRRRPCLHPTTAARRRSSRPKAAFAVPSSTTRPCSTIPTSCPDGGGGRAPRRRQRAAAGRPARTSCARFAPRARGSSRRRDAERRRVERDLHDGAQQRLVALAVSLRTIRDPPRADLETRRPGELEARRRGPGARSPSSASWPRASIRRSSRELGLGAAVAVAGATGRRSRSASMSPRWAACRRRVETAAYFVGVRGAGERGQARGAPPGVAVRASRADVLRLERRPTTASAARTLRARGLRGLVDRIAAVDGTITVTSPPGGGTLIEATIPCGS